MLYFVYACGTCFNMLYFYSDLKRWLDEPDNFKILESVFNSTSNYARLISTCTTTAGRLLFIRFKATTRDAMGMNMVTKVRNNTYIYNTCTYMYKIRLYGRITLTLTSKGISVLNTTQNTIVFALTLR